MLPETDVNMRAEARAAGETRAARGRGSKRVERRRAPDTTRRALRRAAPQNLCTALHFAAAFGGQDHPAIVRVRARGA